jgi:hypothetical protein
MNKILTARQRYQRVYYLRHKRIKRMNEYRPQKDRYNCYNIFHAIPRWLFRPRRHKKIKRKKPLGKLDEIEIVGDEIILRFF